MKKVSKLISSFFVMINLILFNIMTGSISYAEDLTPDTYTPGSTGSIDKPFVIQYTGKVTGFFRQISIIIAVLTIMFVGVKYITGSLSQKADYKKDLIPIAIGILLICFLTAIISTVVEFATSL